MFKKAPVKGFLGTQQLELSWLDGQIGAMPIFEDEEMAIAACVELGEDPHEIITVATESRFPVDFDD